MPRSPPVSSATPTSPIGSSDLSAALTNLVQDPASAVFKSQALASLDAVIGLLSSDPFLSGSPRAT